MSSLSRLACAQSHQVYKVGRFVPSAAAVKRQYGGDVQFQPEKGARVIDMRSDVLTKPTPAVRDAMAKASADDDVYREERTVLGNVQLFGMKCDSCVPIQATCIDSETGHGQAEEGN